MTARDGPAEGVDVALRDGSTVRLRPARPDDFDAVRAFLAGLSDRSRWLRFFGDMNLRAAATVAVRSPRSVSLLAVTGADAQVIGHGMYVRGRAGGAEVAFAVADDWQGHGIATILLAQLADVAAADGIHTFTALVMPENHGMIDVFRESGYPVQVRSQPDVIEVTFPTDPGPEGRRRFDERERTAAVAAVGHVLRPSSVVVVGASRRRGTVGGEVIHNLVAGGFAGSLYAVGSDADEIEGVLVHGSVRALPEPVELAVIAVPAADVVETARACGERGVRALVILSAGFAEVGEAGAARQRELLAVCRAAGMRVVGPNCLGVLNTDPEISLNATFAPGAPPAGTVGFASQSGAFGIAAIDLAAERSLGLSAFVSAGDKADLSGNDFLQFWEADERTAAIVLYLESFGNPRKFGRIARRVSSVKPVIAVKSGRSAAGQRAVSSHTGAMVAASDTTVDALFAHAGVIRTDTIGEMFDVASLLCRQPLPAGDRVAVVTNAGGPGILCADALVAQDLRVEPLAEGTQRALREVLVPEASVGNPVDLIGAAGAAAYARVLELVLADHGVDAVICLFVRPLATRTADVARAVDEVAGRHATTPVLAVYLGAGRPAPPAAEQPGVPVFATPEEAARALGHAVRHARRRASPPDPVPDLDGLDLDRAAALVSSALGGGGGWLEPAGVDALLGAFGIPIAPGRRAEGTEMILGVVGDPAFGPLVAVGAGGTAAELIRDIQVRLAPVGRREAAEMIRALRTFPLLDGYRGSPRADVAALEDAVMRLAALAAAHPEIAELDCDPVIAGAAGAVVLGARVRIAPAPPPRPVGALDR